jgi:hypothetical protein
VNVPTPSLVVSLPVAVIGRPAGHVAERIEPAALLLLANHVQIDHRPPAHPALTEGVDGRLDDPHRDLLFRVELEVRVQLVVADLGSSGQATGLAVLMALRVAV